MKNGKLPSDLLGENMSMEETRDVHVPAKPVSDDWGEDWGDVTSPTFDVHDALTTHITDLLADG